VLGLVFGLFTSLPGYTLIDTIKTLILPFKIQLALPGRGGGGISYIKIEPDTHLQKIAVKEGFNLKKMMTCSLKMQMILPKCFIGHILNDI